ncbi:MAG: large conductance mechanosensitive channel protein MscL [Candidatus Limnocylindrales bacterium]
MAGFKEFLLKSNALALAVAVIIGIALGNVVNSLVNDIIMPPIGKLLGNVDFRALKVSLGGTAADGTEVAIRWGMFLNSVISFVIVALVVYWISKMLIKDEAPAGPSDEVVLLTEIRDALRAR